MSVKITQVDAFADRPFAGNPAAVCILPGPASERWMQDVAREMNLSETAFLHRLDEENTYQLRWFTPTVEVALCGHATLAASHVLWEEAKVDPGKPLRFSTRSGTLAASKQDGLIELDFPACPARTTSTPGGLADALGTSILSTSRNSMDLLVEVGSEEEVRKLQPDFGRIKGVLLANEEGSPIRGVIVTARAETSGFDFVSRFFAPSCGVDEDPVTGSAHCAMGPFWSERLGKTEMVGYQASARGGTVRVRLERDRVFLGGKAVTVLRGELLSSPS